MSRVAPGNQTARVGGWISLRPSPAINDALAAANANFTNAMPTARGRFRLAPQRHYPGLLRGMRRLDRENPLPSNGNHNKRVRILVIKVKLIECD